MAGSSFRILHGLLSELPVCDRGRCGDRLAESGPGHTIVHGRHTIVHGMAHHASQTSSKVRRVEKDASAQSTQDDRFARV